jgi:hypothetical protein
VLFAWLLALPALAQSTGGSFGGGSFETPAAEVEQEDRPRAPRRSRAHDERPRSRSGERGQGHEVVIIGSVVAVGLLAIVGFWARDLILSILTGLAGRKKSCVDCGAVAHPRRGRCPRCNGRMEKII